MKRSGFSLLELLIVVSLVGLLASILVPSLISVRKKVYDVGAQAYLREVAMAVEGKRSLTFQPPPAQPCFQLVGRTDEPPSVKECVYSPDDKGGYTITILSTSGRSYFFDGQHLREQ